MEHRLQKEDIERVGQLNGVRHGIVLHRIDKYYCKPMRYSGLCPSNCVGGCGRRLKQILEVEGDNKIASLVWAAREAAAEAAETAHEEQSGIVADKGNVFENILGIL
jgi:hypothetical protein